MKRTITSLFVIAGGIVLLLANTNVEPVRSLAATWWPAALIIAALLMLWQDRRNYIWPILLSVFGLILLINNLKISNINFGDIFLPAIILAIGISMLVKSNQSSSRDSSDRDHEEIVAVLSGSSSKNTSDKFFGSKITAVMGGVELDLSKARIDKTATLDTFIFMGGIELRVPEDVIVKNRSTMFLGGIENKTNPVESTRSPILYIDGTTIMGGIEIKR